MNTTSPRIWLGTITVFFAAILFGSLANSLPSSPSDDISAAVAAGGAPDVKQAGADAFLNAFSALLVSIDKTQAPSYVSAALQLRPDLKDKITAAAGNIETNTGTRPTPTPCNSQNRRKVAICCHGHTYYLNPRAARRQLQHHPDCTRGECPGDDDGDG